MTEFAQPRVAKSLKQQLLMWVLVPLLALLAISTVISYSRALHFANLAYDRSLFRAALALADQVEVQDTRILINLPQVAKDLLNYDKDDVIYYRISAPDGSLVLGEATLPLPQVVPRASAHRYYDDQFDGQSVRVVAFALPIVDAGIQGNILVQVAETRTKRELMVTEIVEEMMIPQLLILLLGAGLTFVGIQRGLLPLQRIQAAINQRSHSDLSELNTADAPTEIQPLLRAMNDLILRVRGVVQLQQQFIADASHQLRTPIAGLQTQAELALREKTTGKVRETLTLILTSAERLSHLLTRLLSMALVDSASGREPKMRAVNLATLATEVTSQFVNTAGHQDLDLGLDIQHHNAMIWGDDLMLREMLANLIDNALCYTPAPGVITVTVDGDAQSIRLSVIDDGIGIPQAERERVFERFHRLNDNQGNGCGLGLAIVHEIVQAHHATIEIKDGLTRTQPAQTGTCVTITFLSHEQ